MAVIKSVDSFLMNLLFKAANPFTKEKLVEALTASGFTEPIADIQQLVLGGGEVIAKKDEVKVNYAPERGVIGVSGCSVPQVMSNFKLLLDILNKELPVTDILKLCEIILTTKVESGTMPKEAISAFVGAEKLGPFKGLFGEETTISTIRLVPKKGSDTREDIEWFDVVIEPLVLLPKLYYLRVVYRSGDLNKVIRFSDGLERRILDIISLIERGGE